MRSNAYSRVAPYCDRALKRHLRQRGIKYQHWACLGGRGGTLEQLITQAERHAPRLLEFNEGINVDTVALLCMERDPEQCHRHYVLKPVFEKLGIAVEHIF